MIRDPLSRPQPLIERVYTYIAFRVGSGPEAEDLTSEVFERAVRYRETFDPRRGEPIAWLIGIARNVIVDAAASASRRNQETDAEPVDERFDDRLLERVMVQRAVDQLNPHDRHLIALRYGAELSARQIAETIGSTAGAVDVALHRARKRLAEIFENDGLGRKESPSAPVEESRGTNNNRGGHIEVEVSD